LLMIANNIVRNFLASGVPVAKSNAVTAVCSSLSVAASRALAFAQSSIDALSLHAGANFSGVYAFTEAVAKGHANAVSVDCWCSGLLVSLAAIVPLCSEACGPTWCVVLPTTASLRAGEHLSGQHLSDGEFAGACGTHAAITRAPTGDAITRAGAGPPVSGALLLGLRPISLVTSAGGVGRNLCLGVDAGAGDGVGSAGDNRGVAVERPVRGATSSCSSSASRNLLHIGLLCSLPSTSRRLSSSTSQMSSVHFFVISYLLSPPA
jgi:hypothetical protein